MRAFAPIKLGFQVESLAELGGWKPITIDRGFRLESAPHCPADGSILQVVCTFVGRDVQVRVGACPSCGHVAYIDRPDRAWLADFYRDTWDQADRDALGEEVERRKRKLAALQLGVEREAVTLAKALPVDRRRAVCEIGCGYGSSLKQLERAGFSRLVGIEASRHRAEVVRGAVAAEVFHTAFEASHTQDALRSLGPFGIVYSIHALEHTTHPDAVIAAAAGLQDAGDYLIVSVPNLEGEPSMGVLFFLPHLHTFTRESLARLAGRFGYRLIDDTMTSGRSLNMVFQKGELHAPGGTPPAAIDRTLAKFVRGLALAQGGPGRRCLWWLKRSDRAGQLWWSGVRALDAWRWNNVVRRHPEDRPRSVLVRALARRRTEVGESPLEIQFADEMTLFYK